MKLFLLEIIQRGQLAAGIDQLERLVARNPDHQQARLLLARAQVNQANEFGGRENFKAAGALLDRAVETYAALEDPTGVCQPGEIETLHRNRVRVWRRAGMADRIEAALDDAQAAGLALR